MSTDPSTPIGPSDQESGYLRRGASVRAHGRKRPAPAAPVHRRPDRPRTCERTRTERLDRCGPLSLSFPLTTATAKAPLRIPCRLEKRNMTDITAETLVRDFDRQSKVSDQDLVAMSLRDFDAWMETMVKGIACLALDCIRRYDAAKGSGRSGTPSRFRTPARPRGSKPDTVWRWIGEWKHVQTWIRDLDDQEKLIRKKNFRYIAQCLRNGAWVLVRVADSLSCREARNAYCRIPRSLRHRRYSISTRRIAKNRGSGRAGIRS